MNRDQNGFHGTVIFTQRVDAHTGFFHTTIKYLHLDFDFRFRVLTADIFCRFGKIEKISENSYGGMPSVFQLGSSEKHIYIDGQNRRGGFFLLPLFYA